MSVVRRKRDEIEAFEHAMQGVRTSGDHHIESRDWSPGLIGRRSAVSVDVRDNSTVEREVIVRIQPTHPRRSRR